MEDATILAPKQLDALELQDYATDRLYQLLADEDQRGLDQILYSSFTIVAPKLPTALLNRALAQVKTELKKLIKAEIKSRVDQL